MTDFEDLLGGEPEAPKRRSRVSREEASTRLAQMTGQVVGNDDDFYGTVEGRRLVSAAATGRTIVEEREFHMPVSKNFLARVLKLDAMTIDRRLRRVEPVGYAGNGEKKRPVYDFSNVLPYLLKPKMDLQTFLDTLNAADLPPIVNKLVWDGLRAKLRYKVEAQESWRTEDCIAVFSETFMMIKDHTQMWVEELREKGGMSDEQCERLEKMVDIYRDDLHKKLLDMPKQRQTRSVIHIEAGPQGDDPGVIDWEDEDE